MQQSMIKGFHEALPSSQNNTNESGKEYKVKYRVQRNRLFGGCRDFVRAYHLQEKDVLNFQHIGECKFKVRITREGRSAENEFQHKKHVDVVPMDEPLGNDDSEEKMVCKGHVVNSRKWPMISRYRGSVRTQPPKMEMIGNLFKVVGDNDEGFFSEALLDYYKNSKAKPQHIIVFGRRKEDPKCL